MLKIKNNCLFYLFLSLFVLTLGACSDDDDALAGITVSLHRETMSSEAQLNRIMVRGANLTDQISFSAQIAPEDVDWCSFRPLKEGAEPVLTASGKRDLNFYVSENRTAKDRSAQITVTLDEGGVVVLHVVQRAFSETAATDREWAEQPYMPRSSDIIYKTYFTTLFHGQKTRNYSIAYDTGKRVARWVAYPMHECFIERTSSIGSRPNPEPWGFDPNQQLPQIAQPLQQNVKSSYGTGHARGHQCASADRYSTRETNAMTFYATNMMPQDYDFNGGLWANIESMVRSNSVRDTLYVVTGTHFAPGYGTIRDRKGNFIAAVPTHCWKVLLRTKSGRTGKAVTDCSADELMGIGFWCENKSYPTDGHVPPIRGFVTSISDIESKTGLRFFRNLSDDVAQKVKAQTSTKGWSQL